MATIRQQLLELVDIKAKLAAAEAELALIKAGGATINQASLTDAVKPVSDKVDLLNQTTVTQFSDVGKKASDAVFKADEALKAAATAAVELSKIPGQLTDVIVNNNEKINVVRDSVQALSTVVTGIDNAVKAIPAAKDFQPAIDAKADKTYVDLELLKKADSIDITSIIARVKALEDTVG
jgi:hypothetical protein